MFNFYTIVSAILDPNYIVYWNIDQEKNKSAY